MGCSHRHLYVHWIEALKKSYRKLPRSIWPGFVGICILGIAIGLAGGAGELSDLVFGIGLFGAPTVFVIWAVAKLDPRGLGEITGHNRWREEQRRSDEFRATGDRESSTATQRSVE